MLILTFALIFSLTWGAPVVHKKSENEIDKIRLDEFQNYLRQITNVLKKYSDFKLEANPNSTEWRKEVLDFISKRPELGRSLDEIKRKETRILHELIKTAQNKNLAPETKNNILHQIANKEPYLAHGLPEIFSEEDVDFMINIINEHLHDSDVTENRIYHLEQIRKRIQEWKDISSSKKSMEEVMQEYENRKSKFKKSAYLHEPGSHKNLEQIWSQFDEQDGDFNPFTFFTLHDLDGDRKLDSVEIEALLQKIVSATFDSDGEEFYHELNRFRNHFIEKFDNNKDHIIDRDEFLSKFDEQGPEIDWESEEEQELFDFEDEFGDPGKPDKEKIKNYLLNHKPENDPEALEEWLLAMSDLESTS